MEVGDVNVNVKKKGRPRKNPIVEVPEPVVGIEGEVEKKKRGRKKKEKVEEEEVKQKKKRGRKAAVKFYSSSIRKKIPLTTVIQDNDKSILHLDIKDETSKIDQNKIVYDVVKGEYSGSNFKLVINSSQISELDKDNLDEKNEKDELEEYIDDEHKESNISDLYEKRLQSRLVQDNTLIQSLESLHNDEHLIEKLTSVNYEKETKTKISKNIENRKRGFFSILESFYESPKWLESTDVCCHWCCNRFDTLPIGLPISYKNGLFTVKGIFCSFACMIAYRDNSKVSISSNTLVNFLFKKLTGVIIVPSKEEYKVFLENTLNDEMFGNDIELKGKYIDALVKLSSEKLTPAPPRESLKMFGGELTIEEFRNNRNTYKIFKLIEYPMSVSRDYIEEVDIQNLKNINLNVFNQAYKHGNNILDDKKVNDAKNRIQNSRDNVVTSNSIDKFLKF
jgi:hypothetical protein